MCKALAPSTEVWEYSKEALLDELGKQKGSPLLEWLAFALLACFLLMVVALAEQRGVPLIRYFTIFIGSVFAGGSIFTLGCPDFLGHSGLHSGRSSGADISV